MKIAHEAPLSIFDIVRERTDYLYALVHLYETNENYLNKFIESTELGYHVILDNSIFELETAFDSDKFLYWINKTSPTEYIIPDVLEDSTGTLQKLGEWKTIYEPQVATGSKSIGVVQGSSYDDIVYCYRSMIEHVDKIAISFDYSFMCDASITDPSQRAYAFMTGRQELLKRMLADGVIDTTVPHHLLGCYLPVEFKAYRDYDWIDTIDTSNPVVAGINNVRYGPEGLDYKISTKLIEYMDVELNHDQLNDIMYNINTFRGFCKWFG